MNISEKAAYVKGLFDGLELDANDKQTKVLKALVSLVNEMAEEVSQLEQGYDDLCDQIDALDEDVSGLEDMLSEDYEDIYGDDDSDCDCGYCGGYGNDAQYEAVCPTCKTTIDITEDSLKDGSIDCPVCGEKLEFDYDEDELDDTASEEE